MYVHLSGESIKASIKLKVCAAKGKQKPKAESALHATRVTYGFVLDSLKGAKSKLQSPQCLLGIAFWEKHRPRQ